MRINNPEEKLIYESPHYKIYSIKNKEPFFRVILIGDVGDGDYMDTENDFTHEEFIKYGIPLLKYIYENLYQIHGFNDLLCDLEDEEEEGLYEDILDWFYIPTAEWGYCHTLTNIIIEYHDEDNEVYKVKLKDIKEN